MYSLINITRCNLQSQDLLQCTNDDEDEFSRTATVQSHCDREVFLVAHLQPVGSPLSIASNMSCFQGFPPVASGNRRGDRGLSAMKRTNEQ